MKPSVDSEAAVGKKDGRRALAGCSQEALISTGLDYEDLYALLGASIITGKTNFPRVRSEGGRDQR